MEGLKRLKSNNFNFTECDAVNKTKDDYRKAMDNVYRFVCERYVITHEYKDIIFKQEFDKDYKNWCLKPEQNGIKSVAPRNIAERMQVLGCPVAIATQDRITVYRGIRPKKADEIQFNDVTNNNNSELPF
jgi:hypothetical protein